MESEENIFTLIKKKKNIADVQTFDFIPVSGKLFSFQPGEYITLYFLNNAFGWQGKSYSISNAPGEKYISLTVKKMGKFSEAIHNLKIGDTVKLIGPEGRFHFTDEMQNIVFLAGGVGISPIHSIIKSLVKEKKISQKKITLFYSNKTKDNIIFFNELEKIAAKNSDFKIIHTLTRTKYKDTEIDELKRIDEPMLKKYNGLKEDNYYFICGSISFANDLWKILNKNKIPESRIITEAFY